MITRGDLCPDDPLTESLIKAFDMQRLACVLAASFADWGILSAKMIRAKYKPYHKALLSVAVRCQGNIERRLALRLLPPGKAAAQWERAVAAAPDDARVVGLADLDAVAWAFPADYRMPGLPRLLDAEWISKHVVPHLAPNATMGADALSVVQYAPEQSCTVRLELTAQGPDGSGGGLVFYGKHHAAGEAGDAALVLAHLAKQESLSFKTAPIVLSQPEVGLQWQSQAKGLEVAPHTLFEPENRTLDLIARAAAGLHAAAAPNLRRRQIVDFAKLEARLGCARCLSAATQRALTTIVQRLRETQADSTSALRLCHGDLHPKNIFIAGDSITLIDFDAAFLAPPEYDLASFAAALIYLGVHADLEQSAIEHAVARWISAYCEAGGRPDKARVGWLTAYCLLDERVYRCLTRLKPGRRNTAERLVAFAHSRVKDAAYAS